MGGLISSRAKGRKRKDNALFQKADRVFAEAVVGTCPAGFFIFCSPPPFLIVGYSVYKKVERLAEQLEKIPVK